MPKRKMRRNKCPRCRGKGTAKTPVFLPEHSMVNRFAGIPDLPTMVTATCTLCYGTGLKPEPSKGCKPA